MKARFQFGMLAVLAALGGTAIGAVLSAAQDGAAPTAADALEWQKAANAYQNRDCATALKIVEPRLKPGAAPGTPARLLSTGYDIAAGCALGARKMDVAYRYALDGTALTEASDQLWRFRLGYELQMRQFEAAVTTIEAMAQGRAGALNALPLEAAYDFNRNLKTAKQDALRRRVLKLLIEKYRPDEIFATLDGFRENYAVLLYEAGDKDGAAAMARAVRDPATANRLSLDPRFRAHFGSDFDLRAEVERHLTEAEGLMRLYPEQLQPVIQVALRLRQLGRPQEAIAVLETARPRIASAKGFSDAARHTNWWWDSVAYSYKMLGKYDEAVAAMRAGAEGKEGGALNVSQVINLAGVQLEFGKVNEALATLAAFDIEKRDLSPFGRMAYRSVRACANARSGKADAVAADLAYMQEHVTDSRTALSEVLLCKGDLDGAAAAIIRQLDDPARRVDALIQFSDFDEEPVKLPEDPREANLAKVKMRADVKAAIAKAGGTRRIHLQDVEL